MSRSDFVPRRLAVALTGASGSVYGLRVLAALQQAPELEIHLTVSPAAVKVLRVEHGISVCLEAFEPSALGLVQSSRLIFHHPEDIAAPLASGSFRVQAMAVVPCSMGCVGNVANGVSGDLVERAADVMIKERRPLILVPRETPLSAIHLENLLKLSRLGVTILPAAPGFYGRPRSIDDLVDFIAGRVLDHLGVSHHLGPRWTGAQER